MAGKHFGAERELELAAFIKPNKAILCGMFKAVSKHGHVFFHN